MLWEAEVLPARVRDYSTAWLDDLCTAGRTLWTRLRPPAPKGAAAAPPRCARRRSCCCRAAMPRSGAACAPLPVDDTRLGARERRVVDHLAAHGASFFDEIAEGTRLLRSELEDALADLVARGRVHCDSYAGLRALLLPASKRSAPSARRRRGAALFGIEDAGRWALVRQAEPIDAAPAARDRSRRPRRPTTRMPSSTSPARCCAATASSPGACSSASRAGCRRGATWCASTAGSRRAARSAAGASSPACPASSSRCRRRSA